MFKFLDFLKKKGDGRKKKTKSPEEEIEIVSCQTFPGYSDFVFRNKGNGKETGTRVFLLADDSN